MTVDSALNSVWISGFAELDEFRSLVKDFPYDLAQPVSDSPDSLDITQADDEAFENSLQLTAVGSDGGLSRLA